MDSSIIEKPASSYFEKDENGMLTVSKETVERLEEIGKELNVTRERVRQIESSAIKKLKHPKVGRKLKNYIEE